MNNSIKFFYGSWGSCCETEKTTKFVLNKFFFIRWQTKMSNADFSSISCTRSSIYLTVINHIDRRRRKKMKSNYRERLEISRGFFNDSWHHRRERFSWITLVVLQMEIAFHFREKTFAFSSLSQGRTFRRLSWVRGNKFSLPRSLCSRCFYISLLRVAYFVLLHEKL